METVLVGRILEHWLNEIQVITTLQHHRLDWTLSEQIPHNRYVRVVAVCDSANPFVCHHPTYLPVLASLISSELEPTVHGVSPPDARNHVTHN